MNLRCDEHGLLPWLGHGECARCKKLYKRILEAPKVCACGVRLLPFGKNLVERIFDAEDDEPTFSARPLCAKCFEWLRLKGVED